MSLPGDECSSEVSAAPTRACACAQRLSGEESATRLLTSYRAKSYTAVTGGLCAMAASTSFG